jgi:signal peptidase I
MKSKTKKEIFSWIRSILIALIIIVIVRDFVFTPAVVSGSSMYPNLKNGDRLIVSRLSNVNRFDEIVFKAPDNPEAEYVKRVIGFPGDTIEIKHNYLYINGEKYSERYLKYNREKSPLLMKNFSLKQSFNVERVPKGQLFVLGDNRLISNDSRKFGFVSKKEVIGKVKIRFWPLNKSTLFK